MDSKRATTKCIADALFSLRYLSYLLIFVQTEIRHISFSGMFDLMTLTIHNSDSFKRFLKTILFSRY